jgi:hypothetical protein
VNRVSPAKLYFITSISSCLRTKVQNLNTTEQNKILNPFGVLNVNFCLKVETNYILLRFLWERFNDALSTVVIV